MSARSILSVLWISMLMTPSLMRAEDGDAYTAGVGYGDPAAKVLLCDSKTVAGNCNAGVGMRPPEGYKEGPVEFEIAKDTGCASCTVEIRIGSGTDEHHLITTLTCGANTAYTLPRGVGIAGLVFPAVTAATGCSDLDVTAHYGMDK